MHFAGNVSNQCNSAALIPPIDEIVQGGGSKPARVRRDPSLSESSKEKKRDLLAKRSAPRTDYENMVESKGEPLQQTKNSRKSRKHKNGIDAPGAHFHSIELQERRSKRTEAYRNAMKETRGRRSRRARVAADIPIATADRKIINSAAQSTHARKPHSATATRKNLETRPALSESTPRAARMSQIFQSARVFQSPEYGCGEKALFEVLPKEDVEQASNSATSISTISNAGEPSSFSFLEDVEIGSDGRHPNQPEGEAKSASSLVKRFIRPFRKDLFKFKVLKLVQVLCAIYIAVFTLGAPGGLRHPDTGFIVDPESAERTERGVILSNGIERPIVAASQFQIVCLGITRISAFFMYPALIMVFTSKFRATITYLSKSPIALYMYKDSHELHVYCGWTILIDSIIHTALHVARWADQGNLNLLYQHFTGVTGILIIVSCLLICIPMTIFRTRIRYEIRKRMHYLFILFFGALMCHTKTPAFPNGGFSCWVFGILMVWYCLDVAYCCFFMTEKIETTKFSVVDCGVRMTMDVSERFQKAGNQGGVCYVCLPWIEKDQWHAFSLFENPSNPAERQIFIQKTGDWTEQVHRCLQRETVRPAWVHGPFPSPYDNATSYDNQILVASGIGITPALSVIRAHKDTRRINLVWAVRDEALLEFFLKHLYLDHDGWNIIFYTGKKKLRDQCIRLEAETNICIISGRPNLKELIPNIIYGVESGLGLPENYTPETKVATSETLASQLLASPGFSASSDLSISLSDAFVGELALQASELGFHLSPDAISQEFGIAGSHEAHDRLTQSIRENLTASFRPWNEHKEASAFVKRLDKKMVLPTWGILYCGGAQQVLKILEKISGEYEIGLHVESFAW